jgi:hypothetical protein
VLSKLARQAVVELATPACVFRVVRVPLALSECDE